MAEMLELLVSCEWRQFSGEVVRQESLDLRETMMRSSKGVSKAMYLIMRTLWRTSFIRLTRLSRAPI